MASVGGESVGDAFSGPELLRNISLIVLGVVGYLVYVLAAGVVARVYLMRDLWVRVAESVSVFNIEATANVMAAGEAASALGEGLADGLDVAGF